MKHFLLIASLLAGFLCAADDRSYFAEDFETPHKEWKLGKGCRILPSAGINGNAALVCERTNPKDYECAVARIKLNVIPGGSYKVTAMYRTENTNPGAKILAPAIEFRANGKYISMNNPTNRPKPSEKWAKAENSFTATEENELILRLFYNDTGRIYFDDIRIEEVGRNKGILYPVAPRESLLDDEGTVIFKAYVWKYKPEQLKNHQVVFTLNGNKKTAVPDKQGYASVKFGKLPDGFYDCNAEIIDLNTKKAVVKNSFRFRRFAGLKRPFYTDRYNRAVINGKPVMPIGIYCTWIRTEKDVKRIAAGGFDYMLTYVPNTLNIQPELNAAARLSYGNTVPGLGSETWRKNVRRSLDFIAANDLKLMGCTNRPEFNHPAVIGPYIADEISITNIPRLKKEREAYLNSMPGRPVVALTDKSSDYVPFSQVVDVLGIDPYPIEYKNSDTIGFERKYLQESLRTGKPIMFVPQAFNWGAYRNDKPYSAFQTPTDEQFRSMVLLPLIYNVKWFCFYSYTGIFELMEKKNPGEAQLFWDQVITKNVKLLRSLEPWILSLEKAPAVKVADKNRTQVDAKAFCCKGRVRAVIVSCGPGNADAEITVPGKSNLRSLFGRTQNLGGGKYRFTGKDIVSDVLTE